MALFMTPRQVAERWGCDAAHVQRLCRTGRLRAMQLGRRGWRISPEALAAYEAAQTSGSASPPSPEARKQEASRTATPPIGALPDGYEPRFPTLWGLPAKTAASPAAGRGRSPKTQKAASQRH